MLYCKVWKTVNYLQLVFQRMTSCFRACCFRSLFWRPQKTGKDIFPQLSQMLRTKMQTRTLMIVVTVVMKHSPLLLLQLVCFLLCLSCLWMSLAFLQTSLGQTSDLFWFSCLLATRKETETETKKQKQKKTKKTVKQYPVWKKKITDFPSKDDKGNGI